MMGADGCGPELRLGRFEQVLEAYLADQRVVGDGEQRTLSRPFIEVFGEGPRGAFDLETEGDLSQIMKCRKGGGSRRQDLTNTLRKRRNQGLGHGTDIETMIVHSDSGLTIPGRLGPEI